MRFASIVDRYLEENKDSDSIIAVHCTHGINRTGYLICRYMIEKLGMSPEEAIKNFEGARGYAIEREAYVSDLKNGCKGGSDTFYTAGGRKVNWRLIKAEQKASVKRERLPPRREQEAVAKKKKKNPPVQRQADPTRYGFRPRDSGPFEPSGQFGRYPDGYDTRPTAGSWREEQRAYQNQNPHNQRIPNPQHFHPGGPPPQQFPPQTFRTRGPNPFSPQYHNIPRQSFFPRFQNALYRQSPPVVSGTPQAGVCKIYSPQNRFPAPSTCNPRPGGGPQEPVRLSGLSRKRWFQQQAAKKKKQNPQDAAVQ